MSFKGLASRISKMFLCFVVLAAGLPTPAADATSKTLEPRKTTASDLVINEVDYDQAGVDAAEFVELKNTGAQSINLDNYSVEIVNGSGGDAVVATTIPLGDVNLAAGDYYVICTNEANTANCDLDVTPDTNLIQNGDPDAVGLRLGETVVEAVSYGGDSGAPYIEGSGAGLRDDPSVLDNGLSRCPDGRDTDQNNLDFRARPITPGGANSCPTDPVFGACGEAATPVHEVEGSGVSSPKVREIHVLEGVVVGDFQDTSTQLGGFFLQEEEAQADADPVTSEGIFVNDDGFGVEVAQGEVVRVRGTVAERNGLTSLTDLTNVEVCSTGDGTATAVSISLPVASLADWERYEGMKVTFPQTLYVTDNATWGRYGEVGLAVNGRLYQPTHLAEPGAAALAQQDLNDRSRIQLDDGSNLQNPLPMPPYLGAGNTLRLGDSLSGLTGVVGYAHSTYEVHPVEAVNFTRVNERPEAAASLGAEQGTETAEVGGLKAASFNVLNYFTTVDHGSGAWLCGPSADMECRGADSDAEFARQRAKVIRAALAINADVLGLMEIENNASAAVQDLVDGINAVAGAGTYDFVDTGVIGADAIKVALIYKPASVTPAGPYAILDASVDPTFLDTENRPSLAQTFEGKWGLKFTVVVNHLKSKSSSCDDAGDPDLNDGQGNCNATRTSAAKALANWLAGDPTGSGSANFLIMGDLNSYAKEDPIKVLKAAGFVNLVETRVASGVYSYQYEGQSGYLDHALASPGLSRLVSRVSIYHINADEPEALDYNDDNQPGLYTSGPYRSSDHDPIVVYLGPSSTLFLPLVKFGS